MIINYCHSETSLSFFFFLFFFNCIALSLSLFPSLCLSLSLSLFHSFSISVFDQFVFSLSLFLSLCLSVSISLFTFEICSYHRRDTYDCLSLLSLLFFSFFIFHISFRLYFPRDTFTRVSSRFLFLSLSWSRVYPQVKDLFIVKYTLPITGLSISFSLSVFFFSFKSINRAAHWSLDRRRKVCENRENLFDISR